LSQPSFERILPLDFTFAYLFHFTSFLSFILPFFISTQINFLHCPLHRHRHHFHYSHLIFTFSFTFCQLIYLIILFVLILPQLNSVPIKASLQLPLSSNALLLELLASPCPRLPILLWPPGALWPLRQLSSQQLRPIPPLSSSSLLPLFLS